MVVTELFWLVNKDANEDIAVQLSWEGQVSPHWLKYYSRNSFISIDSGGRNAMQEASSSVNGSCLIFGVYL